MLQIDLSVTPVFSQAAVRSPSETRMDWALLQWGLWLQVCTWEVTLWASVCADALKEPFYCFCGLKKTNLHSGGISPHQFCQIQEMRLHSKEWKSICFLSTLGPAALLHLKVPVLPRLLFSFDIMKVLVEMTVRPVIPKAGIWDTACHTWKNCSRRGEGKLAWCDFRTAG